MRERSYHTKSTNRSSLNQKQTPRSSQNKKGKAKIAPIGGKKKTSPLKSN
jgi:hypothetical protein